MAFAPGFAAAEVLREEGRPVESVAVEGSYDGEGHSLGLSADAAPEPDNSAISAVA